jgi:hypothetical protein
MLYCAFHSASATMNAPSSAAAAARAGRLAETRRLLKLARTLQAKRAQDFAQLVGSSAQAVAPLYPAHACLKGESTSELLRFCFWRGLSPR